MMAKNDRSKMRIVVVDLEGSDQTVQEGLRTITSTVGRGLYAPRILLQPMPLPSGGTSEDLTPAQQVLDLDGDTMSAELGATATSPSPRPRRARRHVTPEVLDLDLDSGEMPFRRFAELKAPQNHFRRFLVIGAWLKQYRGENSITPDHIYTCYRAMKWSNPRDFGQPFRDSKRTYGWWNNGPRDNTWEINHIGLNDVDVLDEHETRA